MALPRDLRTFFKFFISLVVKSKSKRFFSTIWHSFIWSIWLVRNEKHFSGKITNVKELEENSVFFSCS